MNAIFWGHDHLDRKERLQVGIGAVAVVALLLIGAEILAPGLGKATFSVSPLLLTGTYLFIANQYAKRENESTPSATPPQTQPISEMTSNPQAGTHFYSEPNSEYFKSNKRFSNSPSPVHSNADREIDENANQTWLPPPPSDKNNNDIFLILKNQELLKSNTSSSSIDFVINNLGEGALEFNNDWDGFNTNISTDNNPFSMPPPILIQ